MTTITGKIENSAGETLHAKITFTSQSAPQFYAGVVETRTIKTIKSHPVTGLFSLMLAAGRYDVSILSGGLTTNFVIAVPDGDSSVSIEDLVITAPAALPGEPPNTVWNGIRPGNLEFDPIPNPAAIEFPVPTDAPPTQQPYAGAGIWNGDAYSYRVTHVTPEGETAASDATTLTTSPVSDMAVRVPLQLNPERATAKRIYRNTTEGGTVYRLLAEIAPGVAYYDDWETHAQFAARSAFAAFAPTYNTTAGIIYAAADSPILYFSVSGLRCLANAVFDYQVNIGSLVVQSASASAYMGMLPVDDMGLFNFNGLTWLLLTESGGNIGLRFLNMPTGAGYVLTSDVNGNATWQPPAGGSGAGLHGNGSPQGVTAANPGTMYLDDLTDSLWWEKSGTGNTGWLQLIA